MTASDAIARLDAALARSGSSVRVYRSSSYVDCDAKIVGLTAQSIRSNSLSSQAQFRAIVSPTKFTEDGSSIQLPLKVSDKVLYNGMQRNITSASHIQIDVTVVRIEIGFAG